MGGVGEKPPKGGGVFDEKSEEAEPLERRVQAPMEVDSTRYYETGHAAVGIGPDGMPVMGGDSPPGPDDGLTDENLVCNAAPGRPTCRHYGALLLPADGVAKGYGRELRQIRRFCTRLKTSAELFEITTNMYACTLREPQEARSVQLIDDFEAEQKRLADEMGEKSGTLNF